METASGPAPNRAISSPPVGITSTVSSRETAAITAVPTRKMLRARRFCPAPQFWATRVEMPEPRLRMGTMTMESTR